MEIIGPDTSQITQRNLLEFFELRHKKFVGELNWSLPEVSSFDIDQYDFPFGRFVLALEKGRCVGGLRLSPTDLQISSAGETYTYMLKDFADQKIETPFSRSHLFEQLPTDGAHWEMTRFVSPNLKTTKALLYHANDSLSVLGARKILTISPTAFPKLLKAMGFDTRPVSEEVVFEDGKSYVALETDVRVDRTSTYREQSSRNVVLES